jgi:hypothetical protein
MLRVEVRIRDQFKGGFLAFAPIGVKHAYCHGTKHLGPESRSCIDNC